MLKKWHIPITKFFYGYIAFLEKQVLFLNVFFLRDVGRILSYNSSLLWRHDVYHDSEA